MNTQAKIFGLCLVIGLAQPALAERPATGSAESDLKRIVQESAEDGRRSLGAQTQYYTRGASVADDLIGQCAKTDFQYWDLAGRRIAEASRQKGRRLQQEVAYVSNRDELLSVREVLLDTPETHFLDGGDNLDAAPVSHAQDLRQRAEWSRLLDSVVDELETAHRADHREAAPLFALAAWERTRCNFAKRNVRVVERALEQSDALTGAPRAANWTPRTLDAMAHIAITADSAELAAQLINVVGDRLETSTRAALEATAAS